MTKENLQIGKPYCVSSSEDCTVTSANGMLLCSVTAGIQSSFVAIETAVTCSSDTAIIVPNFDGASALQSASGGSSSKPFVTITPAVDLQLTPDAVTYLGTLEEHTDLSELTIESSDTEVKVAELWFQIGESPVGILWPDELTWLKDSIACYAPIMRASTLYCVLLRSHPDGTLVADLLYQLAQ